MRRMRPPCIVTRSKGSGCRRPVTPPRRTARLGHRRALGTQGAPSSSPSAPAGNRALGTVLAREDARLSSSPSSATRAIAHSERCSRARTRDVSSSPSSATRAIAHSGRCSRASLSSASAGATRRATRPTSSSRRPPAACTCPTSRLPRGPTARTRSAASRSRARSSTA